MVKDYSNANAEIWYREILASPEKFPFFFTYGGVAHPGFSSADISEISRDTKTFAKKENTLIEFLLDNTVKITLDTSFYPSYGVSEWTVYFENISDSDSGVLSELKSRLCLNGEHPVLKGIMGDQYNSYRPYALDLSDAPVHFTSNSGRPTHVNFPYFNLEYGNGGAIFAIGWSGTWTADFDSDGVNTVYTAQSVNGINTFLKSGEKIRTALFVYAPYTVRGENYSVNFWRKWFVDCNLPASDSSGAPLEPFSTCALASDTGLPNSDGSISERSTTWRPSLEKMLAEDAKVDFRWFDAGWYVAPDGSSPVTDWWGSVGTWELDPVKWPDDTFRQSTDFAREHGMKTLMWFEPERVTDVDSLVKNYGYKAEWAIKREGTRAISNNIGIPECLEWTTTRVCKVLRDNRVEMYREDNNSDPGSLWKYLDSIEGENRNGITECRFVAAHYKLWDDIITCTLGHGGCGFADSCASGGGRNDLESLRRGIPLLRSDSDRTSTSLRLSMTTSFNKWIPFCGANTKEKESQLAPTGISDVYTWRASYLPSLNVDFQFVQNKENNFDILRFGLKEWKKVAPYLLKDFYILTPWHSENDRTSFSAFCYFDEETESGVIQLFRMERCEEDTIKIKLSFAENGKRYTLTDEDSGEAFSSDGKTLRENGICFTLKELRSARLVWIKAE